MEEADKAICTAEIASNVSRSIVKGKVLILEGSIFLNQDLVQKRKYLCKHSWVKMLLLRWSGLGNFMGRAEEHLFDPVDLFTTDSALQVSKALCTTDIE